MNGDVLEATWRVAGALERLEVRFHLGGSLSSSLHGFPRATLDADLVADLAPGLGRALCTELGKEFYADEPAIEEAIRERRSFNVIHLQTMFKVDVFLVKDTPFDRESFRRARAEPVGPEGKALLVSTPEDTVLHKLLWFQKGGETSDRQWGDLVGVLKVQGRRVDAAYLRRWASVLGLEDLLASALAEAKLPTR
jgi:hypothetical protein